MVLALAWGWGWFWLCVFCLMRRGGMGVLVQAARTTGRRCFTAPPTHTHRLDSMCVTGGCSAVNACGTDSFLTPMSIFSLRCYCAALSCTLPLVLSCDLQQHSQPDAAACVVVSRENYPQLGHFCKVSALSLILLSHAFPRVCASRRSARPLSPLLFPHDRAPQLRLLQRGCYNEIATDAP